MSYQAQKALLVTVFILCGIVSASAQAPSRPYLTLGDSIPFGFNPLVPLNTPNLLSFYLGYPQVVAQANPALHLANASCPGETSSSFITGTPPDDGCHEWRAALPLFVTYSSSAQSQIAYAVSFLRANPTTSLVTITIGGDDLLLLENTCAASSADQSVVQSCELAGIGKVLATYARNLTEIYLAIRIRAHYRGPIVAVNYFSPDYHNLLETVSLIELNGITQALTSAFGGKVADAFSAFQAASAAGGGLPCAPNVGLAFPNPPPFSGCNVHPTPLGQQLIGNLVLQALK